jgi:hypothetical protein
MAGEELDISGLMTWDEGLPRPQWDLIASWFESRQSSDAPQEAWISVERAWLAELVTALGAGYVVVESENFLALVPTAGEIGRSLLPFAEQCRASLLTVLGEVADFEGFGKVVLMTMEDRDDYYRYISHFYPEGDHGGSAGINIRQGFSHVVLNGTFRWEWQSIVAHELTHVSLTHLSMPQWIEEGLAQMFEHDMAGRSLLLVDGEMAAGHKRYWGKKGLDAFWRGDGFSRPGKVQELSYQLAEILARFLVEESRPRWFGWSRESQRKFFAFLRDARAIDCGEASCRQWLGFGLSELAARFLGPGSWSPSL